MDTVHLYPLYCFGNAVRLRTDAFANYSSLILHGLVTGGTLNSRGQALRIEVGAVDELRAGVHIYRFPDGHNWHAV
ncbi:MAG TPA: hypothetical protein VI524_11345 [Anaerolineales bacterium]|nr:hypothetical protein [Anaerolineales bacterium]